MVLWEVVLLMELGRLNLHQSFEHWCRGLQNHRGFDIVPLDWLDVNEARSISLIDPTLKDQLQRELNDARVAGRQPAGSTDVALDFAERPLVQLSGLLGFRWFGRLKTSPRSRQTDRDRNGRTSRACS